MPEELKDFARRWFEEVWNQQREAAIGEMFHPEGQSRGLPEPDSVIRGPEEFKAVHRTFIHTFPDLHVHLDDLIAEDNKVAVRWTATMTHLGHELGYAPTGKKLGISGSSFLRCREGKIIESWNTMDFTRLRAQMQ